jgi:hypothetical protein
MNTAPSHLFLKTLLGIYLLFVKKEDGEIFGNLPFA